MSILTEQAVVVSQSAMKTDKATKRLALFNEDGTPASLGGGGSGGGVSPVATANITAGPHTATSSEEFLRFDCTAAAISLVLPNTGLTTRNIWRAVKMDTGSNPINVTIEGGGTFQNGTTTFVCTTPYSCYSFAVDSSGNCVVF